MRLWTTAGGARASWDGESEIPLVKCRRLVGGRRRLLKSLSESCWCFVAAVILPRGKEDAASGSRSAAGQIPPPRLEPYEGDARAPKKKQLKKSEKHCSERRCTSVSKNFRRNSAQRSKLDSL